MAVQNRKQRVIATGEMVVLCVCTYCLCSTCHELFLSCTAHKRKSWYIYKRFSKDWTTALHSWVASQQQGEITGSRAMSGGIFRIISPDTEEQRSGVRLGEASGWVCWILLKQEMSWPTTYFEDIPRTLHRLQERKADLQLLWETEQHSSRDSGLLPKWTQRAHEG